MLYRVNNNQRQGEGRWGRTKVTNSTKNEYSSHKQQQQQQESSRTPSSSSTNPVTVSRAIDRSHTYSVLSFAQEPILPMRTVREEDV